MEKRNTGSLLVFVVACYAVAFVAGIITRPQIATWYAQLARPAWGPPNWLFAPVWTILYGMVAVAGWKVWCAPASRLRTAALSTFWLQLALNFAWSPVFFSLHHIAAAFFVISGLLILVLMFIVLTLKFQRTAAGLFVPYLLWISFAAVLNYTIWMMNANPPVAGKPGLIAVALRLTDPTDEWGFPSRDSWGKTSALLFDRDWKGENPSPAKATEVRLLWTPTTLFLRFAAKYQSLNIYPDARSDGWRDQLWDRDVAETFLQPDSSDSLKYKEFEVGPNGFWIDLDISHGQKEELHSGLKRRVVLNEVDKTWTAELAIPMKALTTAFDPGHEWRVNFFRVEGQAEPRFYSAWSATNTSAPNFHVQSAFGTLRFQETP